MGVKVIIGKANQLIFSCPGCKHEHVINTSWQFNGDVNKPTFSPSVKVSSPRSGTLCHSFVTDGKIQFLSDCVHELAGQTVELPDMDPKEWEVYQ